MKLDLAEKGLIAFLDAHGWNSVKLSLEMPYQPDYIQRILDCLSSGLTAVLQGVRAEHLAEAPLKIEMKLKGEDRVLLRIEYPFHHQSEYDPRPSMTLFRDTLLQAISSEFLQRAPDPPPRQRGRPRKPGG